MGIIEMSDTEKRLDAALALLRISVMHHVFLSGAPPDQHGRVSKLFLDTWVHIVRSSDSSIDAAALVEVVAMVSEEGGG